MERLHTGHNYSQSPDPESNPSQPRSFRTDCWFPLLATCCQSAPDQGAPALRSYGRSLKGGEAWPSTPASSPDLALSATRPESILAQSATRTNPFWPGVPQGRI